MSTFRRFVFFLKKAFYSAYVKEDSRNVRQFSDHRRMVTIFDLKCQRYWLSYFDALNVFKQHEELDETFSQP